MIKGKKRFVLICCLCFILFLFGVGLLLYPMISVYFADSSRSEVRTEYNEVLETMDTSELHSARAAAQQHNQQLFSGQLNCLDPTNNGYFNQLDISGTGIMGYISIPKLGVFLPIYHGTGDDVLQHGAGHMPQSSLPIGGENTHAVVTAHSGMATNPMFSDLELLEIGDIFQIEVLDEVLTYEVSNIETVLPQQIESIQLRPGEDLVTLITCTPFGVNTHRLLVQGTRISTPIHDDTVSEETGPTGEGIESVWMTQYRNSILTGLGVVGILVLIFCLVIYVRKIIKKRTRTKNEQENS